MRYRQQLFASTISLVLLTTIFSSAAAQTPDPTPALFTVSSVQSRFEESPLATDEWNAEIAQLDSATGLHQVFLPLWGADAGAYARLAYGLRWSPLGELLAITLIDHQGRAALAVLNTAQDTWIQAVSPDSGFTHISAASWSSDAGSLAFSGIKTGEDQEQLYLLNLDQGALQPLGTGRNPVFSSDGVWMAYLDEDADLMVLNLSDHTEHTITPPINDNQMLLWTPDSQFVTWVGATQLYNINIETGEATLFWELSDLDFALPELEILGAGWSPDGKSLVFTLLGRDGENGLSQIRVLDIESGESTVIAERRFEGTLPDDPRLFIDVSYQPPNVSLPGAETGDF